MFIHHLTAMAVILTYFGVFDIFKKHYFESLTYHYFQIVGDIRPAA